MGFLSLRSCVELVPQIHFAVNASNAAVLNINFKTSTQVQPSQHFQTFMIMLPSQNNIQPNSQPLFPAAYAVHFFHLRFPFLDYCLPLPEEQTGAVWEPAKQQSFCFLPVIRSTVIPVHTMKVYGGVEV